MKNESEMGEFSRQARKASFCKGGLDSSVLPPAQKRSLTQHHAKIPPFQIVPASVAHIAHIAAHMRGADRREVWASHRHTPLEALGESLLRSDRAWSCFVEDRPAGMWGVARVGSLLSFTGAPWLLCTPELFRVGRAFARRSRVYVARMQKDFPCLENWCHAENAASLRWLAWCGFTLAPEPETYGVAGEVFYHFWKE